MIPTFLQWHLVDSIYDMVTYYSLEVWFDMGREIVGFFFRLYMGL